MAHNASTMMPDASGIGLFLAKHFVEAHGGRIGFSSSDGAGITFWFELPLGAGKAMGREGEVIAASGVAA